MNPHVKGFFIHEREGIGYDWREDHVQRGFRLWRWTLCKWREKQIYRFELNADTPLTFVQDTGDQIRPCKPGESFISDLGSIPPFVQPYIRKEGVEYAFHDKVYDDAILWVKAFGEAVWRAVAVTRSEGDALLRTMAQCTKEPHGWWKSSGIWAVVRTFAWACGYKPHTGPLPEPYNCQAEKPDVDPPGGYGGG